MMWSCCTQEELTFSTTFDINIWMNTRYLKVNVRSTKQQPTIASFNRCCSPDNARKLTNRITEFIIHDMGPISTVDGQGFQALFKQLLVEPNYTVRTFTDTYVL